MGPFLSRSAVIVHPNRQHVYQTVLAAQEAGLLRRFVTSYYWQASEPFAVLARRLSRGTAIERRLRRRWDPGIDPSLITGHPYYHLLAAASTPLGRISKRLPAHADWWADFQFDRWASRWLRKQPSPGIVHGFERAALHTLRTARQMGAVSVLDVHSAHEYLRHEINVERERLGHAPVDYPVDRVSAERDAADIMLVPSTYVRRCLIEHGVSANAIVVVPYGVDETRFSPVRSASVGRFRVLFAGRVGLGKGIEYLIDAWRRLDLHDGELVIAGSVDPDSRHLRSASPTIRWVGNVSFSVIHSLYQSSDVLVLPSLSDSFGLVICEAMASGLPVVATSSCGAPVRDQVDGYVVPTRNADAIAERLRRLHEDPELRIRMGMAGRSHILENYTWRHYRQRIKAVYTAILAGHPIQQAVDSVA